MLLNVKVAFFFYTVKDNDTEFKSSNVLELLEK